MNDKVVLDGQSSGAVAANTGGDRVFREAFTLIKRSIMETIPVSVALGTLVTLFYCMRIGYLPIDGLESIATLGATVAFSAALFLLCFFLLLVVPLGVTHWGSNSVAKEALTRWFFIAPLINFKKLGEVPAVKLSRWRIFLITGSVFFASWSTLFASSAASGYEILSEYASTLNVFRLASAVVILWYVMAGGGSGNRFFNSLIRLSGVIVWAVVYAYAVLPVILWPTFTGLNFDSTSLELVYIVVAGSVLWFVYSIHLAVQLRTKPGRETPWKITFIFSGLLALMVFPAIAIQPKFHDILMNLTSVRLSNVQLVLKPAACATLRASGIAVTKSVSSEKADDEIVGCLLQEATVLLRIGERWQISVCDVLANPIEPRRLTIFSADVASWEQASTNAKYLSKNSIAPKDCFK